MLQAQQQLLGLGSFLEDARAYMKGQMACGSVREVMLWERLTSTKRAVKEALADDFDTPRVVNAILGLARHGNGQLRAASKEPGVPRSPAVFGAIISYFEQFLKLLEFLWAINSVFQETAARPPCVVWWRSWCGSGRRSGSLRWPCPRPRGGPTAAAPREAAPAGGMRHPAPGPDCPWHQHQGQKQYNVHVGTAGSKDKRPKSSGLRMERSHEPAQTRCACALC